MVLGVNDESQISEIDIFENYEPEYKESLIKPLSLNACAISREVKSQFNRFSCAFKYNASFLQKYKKYELTEDEIAFIESTIRVME